ncbi:uncharacterized protein LOC112569241 [Pomacea canaliculata]|uniref:uncharacterized protein LOC112569241 n=1 Tax=Pomacea canaliculata TaxID=400727 RepID=UPI000D7394AC|nr:uncharacterized protein LOC112569241 [Pomacea canaliculata]
MSDRCGKGSSPHHGAGGAGGVQPRGCALTCADMGTYRCRGVFGATEDSSEYTDLQLRQPPGTPRVTYDHETPGHRRATWRLSCHADAGLPPQEFQWYVKAPDMRHFQIAEGQAEVEYFTNDGCRVMSRRALLVSLATEDRGTMYRCALPDHVDDDRYYDEVTVEQLPAVSIKEATGDLNCVDDNCLMQAETKSQKNSSQRKCISTSTIGLFAVVSYLTGYSLSLVNIKE